MLVVIQGIINVAVTPQISGRRTMVRSSNVELNVAVTPQISGRRTAGVLLLALSLRCSHSSILRSPHLMVRSPLICSVKPQVRRRKIGMLQAREGANDWIFRCRSITGFARRITTTHNGRRSKSLGFYVDRGLQIRIQPRAAASASEGRLINTAFRIDRAAPRTRLRRICRGDSDHRDARRLGFVFKLAPNLERRDVQHLPIQAGLGLHVLAGIISVAFGAGGHVLDFEVFYGDAAEIAYKRSGDAVAPRVAAARDLARDRAIFAFRRWRRFEPRLHRASSR